MRRIQFEQIRALVSVAALSLALVAGIAGTTESAAARTNAEALCEYAGGTITRGPSTDYYRYFTCDLSNGASFTCGIGAVGGSYCRFSPGSIVLP